MRRLLLLLLLCAPGLALAADPLHGLSRWGTGEYRWFGFALYQASLWAADDPQQAPLALRLEYRRSLSGATIAEASVREMRRLGSDEASLQRWQRQMAALFPDVRAGDALLGRYHTGGAEFWFNDRRLGEIADAQFARQFFAIWLDPQTSAPQLRAALLRRSSP